MSIQVNQKASEEDFSVTLSLLSCKIGSLCDVLEDVVRSKSGGQLENQVIALASAIRLHADAVDDVSTFIKC